MEYSIFSTISSSSSQVSIFTAVLTTLFCLLIAALTLRSKSKSTKILTTSKTPSFDNIKVTKIVSESLNCVKMMEMVERVSGASMMEQLVPEITTHALSYLDYPSLCRVSMTNSLMRKAANDDNAWKALYHKDFTLEQDTVKPVNGWKAYYAATRAVLNTNSRFFNIIREGSLQAMGHFWLNADYVKCFHASGEFFSGFNAVMENWQMAFFWEPGVADFQVQDVRVRVLADCAWVTMKTYVNIDNNPLVINESFFVTNVFELHNGRWLMVHHHSSMMVENGGAVQQNLLG